MVTVRPFRGLRYAAPQDAKLYAPPYDVIDAELRQTLLARSAHNIVHLDLGPMPPDEGWYAQAADTLRAWLAGRFLRRDEEPAFYGYCQAFTWAKRRYVRSGFFGRVKLEPWGRGIHRHELTRNQPKADRLRLMRALNMQTSPVFGLFEDPEGAVAAILSGPAGPGADLVEVADDDGVEHRLWAIRDADNVAGLQRALAQSEVVIADGHHRYETALALSAERRATSGPSDADDVLMCLVPRNDSGLLVLPTHRVVRASPLQGEALLTALRQRFAVTRTDVPLAQAIAGQAQTLGLRLQGASYILRPLRSRVDSEELAVTLLQERLLEPVLGITPAQVAASDLIVYTIDADEACAMVDAGEAALAVILNPTPLDAVWRAALQDQVMPQKSTFFYPKLLTGLVMNPLWA